MSDAPDIVPNVAIIVEDGEITTIRSDHPELLGTVTLIDLTENTKGSDAPEMIPLLTPGYEGYFGCTLAVEEEDIRALVKAIVDAEEQIDPEE